MNKILKGIGFEPVIDYKEMPLNEFAQGQQNYTQEIEVIDPTTGEIKKVTLQSALDTYGDVDTNVRVPYIKGKDTVKTSTPDIMSKTARSANNGAKKGGGGGSKSTPAEKVDYTKKSDVVDRYKEIDDTLNDIEKSMSKVNKEADRMFGSARLKQMEKEKNLLLQ
jgi:hypothetical protein